MVTIRRVLTASLIALPATLASLGNAQAEGAYGHQRNNRHAGYVRDYSARLHVTTPRAAHWSERRRHGQRRLDAVRQDRHH